MLPEYLRYWKLGKAPFSLTPDPDMLYMSKQHQEGLIRLKYAVVSNKGGALLVSENAGDGKTSLLAKLRQDLHRQYQGRCRVVFIDHPTLTANQMVVEIARQLGVDRGTTDKLALLNQLREFLLECHGQDSKCVVILDEGQMLCHRPDLLQELRILLNFCVSDAFLLTFILSGQKPLDEAIRAMPEFYQRLPVRFFLRNLSRDDTRELIRYRLIKAGNPPQREIFSEDGYTGIFNYSKGCPRIICSVADLSLVIAHSRFSGKVDFVEVSQACSDMSRTDGSYHYFYFLKSFKQEQDTPPDSGEQFGEETFCTCPSCGSRNALNAACCSGCGAEFTQKAEDSSPALAEAQPAPSAEDENTGREQAPETEQVKAEKTPPREKAVTEKQEQIPLAFEKQASGEAGPGTVEIDGEQEQKPGKVRFVFEEPDDEEMIKCPLCGLLIKKAQSRLCPNCGENLGALADKPGPELRESSPGGETGKGPARKKADRPALERFFICPFCGASNPDESSECSKCGFSVKGGSDEELLLSQAEKLSLRKYILSKSYLDGGQSSGLPGEELFFIPLGKMWSRSAVLQFSNGGSRVSFTTRCGLIFTSSKLRLVFTDGLEELAYETVADVSVERLEKKGQTLLYQLVVKTPGGCYRISLPFRREVARLMSTMLQRYLLAKSRSTASLSGAGTPQVKGSGE